MTTTIDRTTTRPTRASRRARSRFTRGLRWGYAGVIVYALTLVLPALTMTKDNDE